jgi:hypothetical protein
MARGEVNLVVVGASTIGFREIIADIKEAISDVSARCSG